MGKGGKRVIMRVFWQRTVTRCRPFIILCNWGQVKALRISPGFFYGFLEIQSGKEWR